MLKRWYIEDEKKSINEFWVW